MILNVAHQLALTKTLARCSQHYGSNQREEFHANTHLLCLCILIKKCSLRYLSSELFFSFRYSLKFFMIQQCRPCVIPSVELPHRKRQLVSVVFLGGSSNINLFLLLHAILLHGSKSLFVCFGHQKQFR